MNPFTQHTQQQGVTYLEHLFFAAGIAWRLSNSVFAFAIHALFPFISIDSTIDLEATADYLQERNQWIENTKLEGQTATPKTDEEENRMVHWLKRGVWFVLFS
jgi:hypothetical protein